MFKWKTSLIEEIVLNSNSSKDFIVGKRNNKIKKIY